MRNTAGTRFWLYVAYAIVLIGFMAMPRTWPAWWHISLWLFAFAAALTYMWLERGENRRARDAAARWLARYNSLADAHDVPDDGHLFEGLDSDEWERVFALVEQMPPGRRSFRRAIAEVDPLFEP